MVFTGLVSGYAEGGFRTTIPGECWRMEVTCDGYFKGVLLGDSIAVNGCCLTVVEFDDDKAGFDVMAETLRLTALEGKTQFNLEKAMANQDRLGGHVVSGHVHGVGELVERTPAKDGSVDFWFKVPARNHDTLVLRHKGSICIDGVSLTVAELSKEGHVRVSIIPHTRKVTTFGTYKVGDKVNIEFEAEGSAGVAQLPYTDEDFMKIAIEEGEKGRATAPPNPWVGSCVVKNGKVVGRGFHKKAGTAHGEVNAMASVANAEDLKGSTVFVTLEPCSHHGRTGPCCEALAAAGIARCVVAVVDPDEKVSGRGMKYLADHGVETRTGVCLDEAEASLAPYLHQRRTGRPYAVMKVATTLDGCVACPDGTSQWITGPEARASGHQIRAESQAIIVGSGTALADNPRLTVRDKDTGAEAVVQPLRVVLDRRGRVVDPALNLFKEHPAAKTMVFTEKRADVFKSLAHVEVVEGAFTLDDVLRNLAGRGILQVMIEGGGAVHTSFLQDNLCDKLVLFQGATVFGEGGRRWLQHPICPTIGSAKFYQLEGVAKLGNDVRMDYLLKPRAKHVDPQ